MTLSKRQIAHQFSRAASTYNDCAQLQTQMAERLIEGIPDDAIGTLVDMGCGTGWALRQLDEKKTFQLIGVDFAPAMIESARSIVPTATFHCCDLESTPFSNDSIDIVFSNAAIQWCDTPSALQEMHRVLKPGGRLCLSTFGPGTLQEIQTAWQESGDPTPRVHQFETARSLKSIVENAGFQNVVCESEVQIQKFASVDELLASIKRLGATNASSTRSTGLLGTRRYRKFRGVLESRLQGGRLELTYECVSVVANNA